MRQWTTDASIEADTRYDPRVCDCGRSHPELRRNAQNNGIGWQCCSCNAVLSLWIPHWHESLRGIDLAGLPLWDRSPRAPGQSSLL